MRAGVGKPPERGRAGGSSWCSRRICSAQTWPDGPATAIITVPLPSSLGQCHHHRATAVITVPPLSSCHRYHHCATATVTMTLLSLLCYHCQATTLITVLLPSSPSHCHRCHHRAILILGEPPSPTPEWEKLPQHPQQDVLLMAAAHRFMGRAFLAQVGELGGALL